MKKNRQILVLAALLFGFLCFPADKVLAASNVVEVPLTVKQNFEENSNEKGIDLTGTYEFRALDIGIPMPGDSDNDRHVFVLDGNNAEKMISLQFQHGGVYRYHLVQTSKDTPSILSNLTRISSRGFLVVASYCVILISVESSGKPSAIPSSFCVR